MLDTHTLEVVARWLKCRNGFEGYVYGTGMVLDDHLSLQRTRREKARGCEKCKWFEPRSSYNACNRDGWIAKADRARLETGDCGPTGKLWQSK